MPLPSPPLAEVIRADVTSVDTAVASLLEFFEPSGGGGFNYLRANKILKAAYRGLHSMNLLTHACNVSKPTLGREPNRHVVEMAAPLAFGRRTQVFDLSPRKFAYGRDRRAPYRISFFFTEGGSVKLYFIQTRKRPYLSLDHYGGLGHVWIRYLLEQEFYGEQFDLEIVDTSQEIPRGPRVLRSYTLDDLPIWSEERLQDHLNVVSKALDRLENQGRAFNPRRLRPLKDADLPLFD